MTRKSTWTSVFSPVGIVLIAISLGLIDAVLGFQRMGKFDRLRVVLGFFTAASLAVMMVCLWSVNRVDKAMDILLDDSLAGVDAGLKMGAVITETQAALIELQPGGEVRLPELTLQRFSAQFGRALERYRESIFLSEEKKIFAAISSSADAYNAAIARLVSGDSQPGDWKRAFEKGTNLRLNVREGVAFNAERSDQLAKNARACTTQVYVAFGILGAVWLVSSVLALTVLAIARLMTETKA